MHGLKIEIISYLACAVAMHAYCKSQYFRVQIIFENLNIIDIFASCYFSRIKIMSP